MDNNYRLLDLTVYGRQETWEDLFTIEAARGKGVGRALIEEVYRRAKQAGSAEVYWQTHETNTTAMKLYDKVAQKSGFSCISTNSVILRKRVWPPATVCTTVVTGLITLIQSVTVWDRHL
jgi:hypothetical protein